MVEKQNAKVITSPKLTLDQVARLHSEFDCQVEKEFRKGTTFYAWGFVEVTQEMVEYAAEEFGVEIADQLGCGYSLSGMWSDWDGCEWYSADLMVAEEIFIPEEIKIIPARVEKEWKKIG